MSSDQFLNSLASEQDSRCSLNRSGDTDYGLHEIFPLYEEKCILSSDCQVILELCMNSKRASACVQKSSSSASVPRCRSNLIRTGRQGQVFRNDAQPQRSAVCLLGVPSMT